MTKIYIERDMVYVVSPEGAKAEMPLPAFVAALAPIPIDTRTFSLPDGAKCFRAQCKAVVLVHQSPPAVYSLKWIAGDSKAPFGPGTKYRIVKLSLPYVIVVATFLPAEGGGVHLSGKNECFFRNEPLDNPEKDELMYPALLNCSKFPVEEGNSLSWICTQHLDHKQYLKLPDGNDRIRAAFKALMRCLLDSGFNLSSEHHEGMSWFTETVNRKVDPRISTVERWEQESEKDPLFAVKVPWIKTGRTVNQVVDRVFQLHNARPASAMTADDLGRIVFNHKK